MRLLLVKNSKVAPLRGLSSDQVTGHPYLIARGRNAPERAFLPEAAASETGLVKAWLTEC